MGHQSITKKQDTRYKQFRIWLLVIIWLLYLGDCIFAQTTFDPMTIGVGARALGMGKAYVAVAEEGDTIFTNPAGLGEIDAFQFTSMSGSIMEEINYTTFGAVYPLGEKQAVGVGFVSARTGGIELRDSGGVLLGTSNFENSVLFASYGRKLTKKLSFGISIKRFIQDGSHLNTGDGNGINLDVGILQRDIGWLSAGAVAQNILDSSTIHYRNGGQDKLPRVLKVGSRMYVLGQGFRAARFSPIELVVVFDADFYLEASKPILTHFGAEYSPTDTLTLRAGIDQDKMNTMGLSFTFAGIGFHYAYHPYSILRSETHYFSLTFDERGWPYEGLPDIFLGSLNLAKT
jgi:hypothetical protein